MTLNTKTFGLLAAISSCTVGVISATAQSVQAFQIFTDEVAYLNELGVQGINNQVVDETFENPIAGAATITFDSGVVSTNSDFQSASDNRVQQGSKEYQGGVGRSTNREVTWSFPSATFPRGIRAFSFEIQGVTNTLAIKGFFDGIAAGEKVVKFEDDAGITNSSYTFFGLVGHDTFDSFTFFDSDDSGNPNDFNFKVDNFTASVPTPALLPGLIGMGIAAIRKKENQVEHEEA